MEKYYYDFLEKNYEKMLKAFKDFARGAFSEDVFHQTLVSCDSHFTSDLSPTESAMMNYVFISFKNNLIRSKQYACVRLTEPITEACECDRVQAPFAVPEVESKIDSKIVVSELEKKFGKELVVLFFRWAVDREPIRALELETGKKNLNYYLNKVKKYAQTLFA